MRKEWEGFIEGSWCNEINVSDVAIKFNMNMSNNLLIKAESLKMLDEINFPEKTNLTICGITKDVDGVGKAWKENKEKAKETLDVFAPLAHRLGISRIKWELEDLSLKYLHPDHYYEIAQLVSQKKAEREMAVNMLIEKISKDVKASGINAKITGRAKDTIVLLGGENIEPAVIESELLTSPYIESVIALPNKMIKMNLAHQFFTCFIVKLFNRIT